VNYWHLAAAILSAAGFAICARIFIKKRQPKPMVCMLGADCNKVVKSEFSTFLGVGLELYGAAYYGLSLAYYVATLVAPQLVSLEVTFVATGVSLVAFLFSVYLTFVQAFYIRSWCSWCLTSAGITTLVFLLAVGASLADGHSFVPLLVAWQDGIVAMHLLGFALGIGGATVADLVFFRFMRDFHISPSERDIIRSLSQALWFGLMLVVVSAIGLFLSSHAGSASYFWPEIALLLVIAVSNASLCLLVMPKLVTAAGNHMTLNVLGIASLRRVAFALASISFVTWYAAFAAVLYAENGSLSPTTFFAGYLAALALGLLASQVIERRYHDDAPPIEAY
jgi:uncharacterized membrane protein